MITTPSPGARLTLLCSVAAVAGCRSVAPDVAPAPVWAPFDATLLYASNHEGQSAVHVRRGLDGEARRISPEGMVANYPEWSPDGNRVVFQSVHDGHYDLWIMDADGESARPLVQSPGTDYLPAFSPDGSQLSFLARRGDDAGRAAPRHHVLDVATGRERPLSLPGPGASEGLSWCPDGRTVVSSLVDGERGADLVRGTVDGSEWTRMTRSDSYDGSPSVSPDGRWIAHYSDDGTHSRIVVRSMDGDGSRTVVDGGKAWSPRWSPDGRWLVYVAQVGDASDLDLMAVPIDGSRSPVTLAGGPGRQSEGTWRPAAIR